MTRAQKVIAEILNASPSEAFLKVTSDEPGEKTLSWRTDVAGIPFEFEANVMTRKGECSIFVEFCRLLSPTDCSTEPIPTDIRTALAVMSAAVKFMRQVVLHVRTKCQRGTLTFASAPGVDNEQRVRLYAHFAHLLARELGGSVEVDRWLKGYIYKISFNFTTPVEHTLSARRGALDDVHRLGIQSTQARRQERYS